LVTSFLLDDLGHFLFDDLGHFFFDLDRLLDDLFDLFFDLDRLFDDHGLGLAGDQRCSRRGHRREAQELPASDLFLYHRVLSFFTSEGRGGIIQPTKQGI